MSYRFPLNNYRGRKIYDFSWADDYGDLGSYVAEPNNPCWKFNGSDPDGLVSICAHILKAGGR